MVNYASQVNTIFHYNSRYENYTIQKMLNITLNGICRNIAYMLWVDLTLKGTVKENLQVIW